MLERGVALPTITTVHDLVTEMQIHPLTVLALSYMKAPNRKSLESLFAIVASEVEAMGVDRFVDVPLRARKPRVRKSEAKAAAL